MATRPGGCMTGSATRWHGSLPSRRQRLGDASLLTTRDLPQHGSGGAGEKRRESCVTSPLPLAWFAGQRLSFEERSSSSLKTTSVGSVSEGAPAGHDRSEWIVAASESYRRACHSAEELLAPGALAELVAPDARDWLFARARRRVAGESEPLHYETELVHRYGHRVAVEVSVDVLEMEVRQRDRGDVP